MACPLINYWSVIVAAAAFWALGAIWYSPILFGKRWQKELGFTDEYLKKANMILIFSLSYVLMFIMVLGMKFVLSGHNPEEITWVNGLWFGLFTGFFFSMATMGINYLYQRRSLVLWLIDGFYIVIGLGIAGIILGVWQ